MHDIDECSSANNQTNKQTNNKLYDLYISNELTGTYFATLNCKIYSDRKWKILINNYCRTLYGHFFAICMFIFHKTEVQTVILRCWMGLNLNWFKSYGLRCHLRPCASLANSQKIATDKWPCTDHNLPFFANYILILPKILSQDFWLCRNSS